MSVTAAVSSTADGRRMSTAAMIRNHIIQREGANAPGLPGRHATMSMVNRPVRAASSCLACTLLSQNHAVAQQSAAAPGGFPQRRMSSAAMIKEMALKKRVAGQGTGDGASDGVQPSCA